MNTLRINLLYSLLFCLLLSTGLVYADTTVYLVRHAEKGEGKDPGLTQMGEFRAKNIAALLASVGVSQIFSTQYKRTLQTAQPLAQYQSIEITPYDPSKLDEFAKQLKQIEGIVLVVGHSNTTPKLTELLSGKEINAIGENEYDNVYQVILSNGQKPIVNRLRTIPSYVLNTPKMRVKLKRVAIDPKNLPMQLQEIKKQP